MQRDDDLNHLQKMKMKKKKKMMLLENETPHFFKIFLKDDVLSPRLAIPRKFVRKHGSRLPDSVRLRVPRGDIWEVRLEKKDDAICLRDGWSDFMKHYRISYGYFLVFRYEGGSRFQVNIFNMTACEIDYPFKPDGGKKSRPAVEPPLVLKSEGVELGTDQVVRPCAFSGKKRKKELSSHSPRSPKIIIRGPRATNTGNASCSLPKSELPSNGEEPNRVIRKKGRFDDHLNSNSLKIHTQAAIAAGKSGALARASSYLCARPSFLVIIGSTSFHPKHYTYLPTKFLKLGILKQGESGYITLHVPSRNTWTVRYSYAGRCTITRGWKEFVLDNELRAGDVLVFELIRITKVTFGIVIFRNDGALRPRTSSVKRRKTFDETVGDKSSRVKCSSRRRANSKVSEENQSFEAVISQRATTTGSLYIPTRFARILLRVNHTNNEATLKVGQRSWPVELKNHISGSDALRMGSGWTQFMRGNDLRVGDVCLFTLVDEEHLVIEVSIRKKRGVDRTTTVTRIT